MAEPQEEGPEFSLNDVLSTLQRRKWVIIQAFVFVSIIGAVTASLSPSIYKTSASLLVETPGNTVMINTTNNGTVNPYVTMRQRQSMPTQLTILQSNEFHRRVSRRVGGDAGISAGLSYAAQPETNIISINSESVDARAASRWANAAAEEYVSLTAESNNGALVQTRTYLQKMRNESRKRLDTAERQLLAFKRKTQLIDNNEAARDEANRVAELKSQAFQAQNELLSLDSTIGGIKERLKKEPLMVADVRINSNPEWEAINSKLAQLKAQRALDGQFFTPESETMRKLNEEIAGLEAAKEGKTAYTRETTEKPNPVIPTLQAQLGELELKRASQAKLVAKLAATSGKEVSRVVQFAPWQVEEERIQRERDQSQKAYLDYNDRLRQLDVDSQIITATASILEPAPVPAAPVGPQRAQQVMLSMVMGLLLGVGFAFLQEFLDDRVNTSEDIERIASLATLGVVPTIPDENNRLLIGQDAFSPITESYRALRTAVQYSYVDHKVNALAVTSAHPGEGKSVTSANLAIAIALQGKRVILVDADLRRPSVHRMFRVEAEPGLTSVLAGEISLEDALHSTAIDGFKVLTAGPLPPNPPELLNSQAMLDLLERFKEHADLVVFDTPPTIPVTDSQVIASHVDGVVLVVEAGQSRKATLKHARDLLERTHGRLLGVVLNKIDQSAKGYYYHYYYRGGYRKYRKYGKQYGYGGGYSQGQSYGQYGYGQYGYGQGGYAYGGSRHKLGVSPNDDLRAVGVQVSLDEQEAETQRLPERLRDWE